MSSSFTLADTASLGDLRTYLGRAARVDDGSVRLIADGNVLAVYTAILYPVGLLDQVPTVLGLRTFALADRVTFDSVVLNRAMLEQLETVTERLGGPMPNAGRRPEDRVPPITATLPPEASAVTWAAISPPRSGWVPLPGIDATALRAQARAGIAEVAETVPTASGDAVVRRIRAEIWGRDTRDAEDLPAGAAFGAESLGFLSDGERVLLFRAGAWTRATTARGHVLVKRRVEARRS